ncbi:MAG: shikimate kinase [Acidimicrobiales bacterium]
MSSRAIVLVGPMGSGKSTVGRALARRLEMSHVDTDELVVEAAGAPIDEIFEHDGEERFRELETEALGEALASPAVVSTGGGIVVTAANRELLRNVDAFVVWLDGSIDALTARVGSGRGRPLLQGDVRAALRDKIDERNPGYLEVADLRVDTTSMRHVDCVDAIVAAMEGAPA